MSVKTALPSGECVNIYLFDVETGKFALVASTAVKDGRLTSTTAQFGQFLVTTGIVKSIK